MCIRDRRLEAWPLRSATALDQAPTVTPEEPHPFVFAQIGTSGLPRGGAGVGGAGGNHGDDSKFDEVGARGATPRSRQAARPPGSSTRKAVWPSSPVVSTLP